MSHIISNISLFVFFASPSASIYGCVSLSSLRPCLTPARSPRSPRLCWAAMSRRTTSTLWRAPGTRRPRCTRSCTERWDEMGRDRTEIWGVLSFFFFFFKRKGKGKKLDCSWSSLHQRLQQHRPLRLSPPDPHPESSLPLPLLAVIEAMVEAPKCPLPHPPFHFQPEDEAW